MASTRTEAVPVRRGDVEYDIDVVTEPVTVQLLCRMFPSVDPITIWLRDTHTNKAYIPDETNSFDLRNEPFTFLSRLDVGGSDRIPDTSSTSTSHGSGFKSVIPSKGGSSSKFSVKIIKADIEKRGKRSVFNPHQGGTYFVEVKESTATVTHILGEIQSKLGVEYRLATSDGMEVQDCSGTRGLNFWKQNSRKFYAVTYAQLYPSKGPLKRPRTDSGVSDADHMEVHVILDEIESLSMSIKDMREKLDKLLTVTKDTRIPLCLKNLISETFICKICHITPMTPPIIFAQCCKSIIGCQKCIDDWYTDLTKPCPACQGDRGYPQTIRLCGLDDLLKGVQPLFSTDINNQ